MADREPLELRYGRLIARAWTDDRFRDQLVSSPLDAFGEYDIEFPDGKQIRVVENTSTLMHLPLHVKARSREAPSVPLMALIGELPAWYDDLVSRACADDSFKKRLLAEPETVYREQGIDLPPGVTIRWVEDTEQVLHFPLPLRPAVEELSVEELSDEQQQEVVGFYYYKIYEYPRARRTPMLDLGRSDGLPSSARRG